MKKEDKTKLELVRIEGICKLILEKIENESTLKSKIENITKTNIKDTKAALKKLNRYQLISIIESTNNINSKDIDNIYEQYRYGLKPGFTIFSFSNVEKDTNINQIEKEIRERLNEIGYIEGQNYTNLKYKSCTKIDEDVYEYSFTYLSKYTYISEKEEPKYIYEMKETYVWMSKNKSFLAIKNSPNKITNDLKNIFEEIFKIELYNIKISKKLIEKIFDMKNMKKGSYIKLDAGEDEAEKVMISDSNFAEKEGLQSRFNDYDMTSTYLNEKIDEDTESTLGVNCNAGKVYLTKNLNASKFRKWSINTIESIISYLSNNDNSLDFDIFKSKNIMSNSIWNLFNKNQKELLEKLCYSVYICAKNKKDSIVLTDDIIKYNNFLSKKFYQRFTYQCEQCNEICFPRCKCGSSDLIMVGNKILCKICGKEMEEFECEEGHINKLLDVQSAINVIPTEDLLNKIKITLKNSFGIDYEGSFYINKKTLTIIEKREGKLVKIDDIQEFKKINDINLSITEKEKLMNEFKNVIKEKCRKSNNENCIKCMDEDKECIMKLFINYDNYRPSPHQAQEFGDVNFKVTNLNGEILQFVGIAKSSTKGDVLNLSDHEAREMLQQILTMSHDKRIDIIGAICPMKFHDQLIKEIEYLSKITQTKIVILDDRFMVKQLKKYRTIKAE